MSKLRKWMGYGVFLGAALGVQAAASPGAFAVPTAPPATPAPPSVSVPLEPQHGSGVRGTVTLSPQGDKTVVHVTMASGAAVRPTLSLQSGSDCMHSASAAGQPIALNPVGPGMDSRTIVAIPIGAFRSRQFVLDVRDATSRQQFSEACARLGR